MKRVIFSIASMLICAVAFCAQFESGKYYRVLNASYNGYALEEDYLSSNTVCKETGSATDYQQMWLWNGSTLQNVYTGHYIQPQGSTSSIFKTGTTSSTITVTKGANGTYKLKCGGNTMHCDASKNVVKWEPEADASYWSIEEVSITKEEVSAARKVFNEWEKGENEFKSQLSKLQSAKYTALSTFFTDKACTELKSEYKTQSDEDLKLAVTKAGLPEQIADIAVKVKNGWKDETDASMSAEFRVQNYGAYAAAGIWRWNSNDGKGLNASQISDMNNPTGIYTTGRDVLFVFVEGTVPSGCELRLSSVSEGISGFGYNNYDNGTVLKEGINIIGAEVDLREYWVMYTVTNKNLKPADMDKIKIHIEGGHVMGYVNYYPNDEEKTNAEYKRILLAANASANASGADKCRLRMATRGEYGLFYWQIMCYNLIWSDGSANLLKNKASCTFETEKFNSTYYKNGYGFKIWKSMRFYDNVLHQEWATMGILKDVADADASNAVYNCFGGQGLYPTYCNCHAYTIMGTQGGNPHSSTGYTHMPGVGAVESSYNGERADFDVWCVGHESGHNNQGAINLQSSTESSNNLFSNIITYYYGYRMSRGGTISDNEAYFQNGTQFSLRDIGMTMRMYYQLYLYYHVAGYKKDFYPTLFTELRADAMNLNSGKESWLKFYQKACRAAGEDLTEFFRFWGFFEAFDTTTFGDYTNHTLSLSQATIDEAIAEIKAEAKEKGWRENLEIMFIDDRSQLRPRTDIWASNETNASKQMKPDNSGTWRSLEYMLNYTGELGDVLTYTQDAEKASYSFTASGSKIQMNGKGGVGFLVCDKEGNIVAHSNHYAFTLPSQIATSAFTIKAINADGTMVEATNETGTEQYREALQNAITEANKILALVDETGTKMGFYKPEQVSTLKQLVEEGKSILTSNEESAYLSKYNEIAVETKRILDDESVQKVTNTGIYLIQSNRNKTRYLDGQDKLVAVTTKNEQQQWAFIATKTADTYYIQNMKTHCFMAPVIDSNSQKLTGWSVSNDKLEDAGTFTLEEAGSGSFYIKTNGVEKGDYYMNIDPSNNMAVWSADDGSKWNIIRIQEIEEFTDKDMKTLMANTNSLINEVCTYSVKNDPITVQNTNADAPYYISSNASAGIEDAHSLDYMIDGKSNTYFSTIGATVKAKRFVTLTLGKGNELSEMRIFYRTATGMHNYKPTEILARAGETTSALKNIATLTGLPSSKTATETYTSPALVAETPANVWRFVINATNNEDAGTYPDFALAVMKFYNIATIIELNAGYEAVDTQLIKNAKSESENADELLQTKTTPLINYYQYKSLLKAYEALKEASEATGIDFTEAEPVQDNAKSGIYDLNGRRVEKVTKSGLYIINGKKLMVK